MVPNIPYTTRGPFFIAQLVSKGLSTKHWPPITHFEQATNTLHLIGSSRGKGPKWDLDNPNVLEGRMSSPT